MDNKNDFLKMERLYEKYKRIMYKEAYTILRDIDDSEDAVQQAFVRIVNSLWRIKEEEAGMTCNFLKIVVRNVAKDIYKKRLYLNTTEDVIDSLEEVLTDEGREVTDIVIDKESVSRIAKEIESLPEIYRDILLLEKVYGYSREESMRILGANYETLKKRLTRAKAKLLEALRREELCDGREDIGKNSK